MKVQALTRPAIVAEGKELKPPYRCFCCRDSGLVSNLSIENYVEGKNPYPFICQRVECEAGRAYMKAWLSSDEERQQQAKKNGGIAIPQRVYQAQFDARLSSWQCEEMQLAERSKWQANLQKTGSRKTESEPNLKEAICFTP